jgi:flotillin
MLRQFLYICRPNELLVVSGKSHRTNNGEPTTFTVVLAGTHFPLAVFADGRSHGSATDSDRAVDAQGAVEWRHSARHPRHRQRQDLLATQRFVYNAVERFLNMPRETIWQTAKQTLEGSLRDVISQLTPRAGQPRPD